MIFPPYRAAQTESLNPEERELHGRQINARGFWNKKVNNHIQVAKYFSL